MKLIAVAKRFTDNIKWSDEWFGELSPEHKLAYLYLLDNCDAVGVWKPNFKLAEFHLGCKLEWDKFKDICGPERIFIMENNYWWIKKFCRYQYSELDENSKSQTTISYIKLLKHHNLWIAYAKGINVKEKLPAKVKAIIENETNASFITIGQDKFPGKTSGWLKANKEAAIESLMMNKFTGMDLAEIYKAVDIETVNYHFKDHNHPYNYFKSVGEKMQKQKKVTPKKQTPVEDYSSFKK